MLLMKASEKNMIDFQKKIKVCPICPIQICYINIMKMFEELKNQFFSFLCGEIMKKKKETYCNLDYFMKHSCKGCKLERKCLEWGRDRIKRYSNSDDIGGTNNSGKSKQEVIA